MVFINWPMGSSTGCQSGGAPFPVVTALARGIGKAMPGGPDPSHQATGTDLDLLGLLLGLSDAAINLVGNPVGILHPCGHIVSELGEFQASQADGF